MLIRHCLFDHKQNTADALSRLRCLKRLHLQGYSGCIFTNFLYISNYNVCICKKKKKKASLILKKSLKSAANLNDSQNEEFCSSVKIFLQSTNILMHVFHLILTKSFPVLQTQYIPQHDK